MKIDFSRHVPLGIEFETECKWFLTGVCICVLLSFGLPSQIFRSRSALFLFVAGRRVLQEGVLMPDFATLLFSSYGMLASAVSAICSLFGVAYHYYYHLQGSKSLYLMRRLPSRGELWRRCLTAPLLGAAGFCLLAVLLTLVYFGIYMLATPAPCLAPNQWQSLFNTLLGGG